MHRGTRAGGTRRRLGRWLPVAAAGVAAVCALIGSAGAASANVVLSNTSSPNIGETGTNTISNAIVRPFTGTGCHTYNYWNGAHVCITIVGSGLNVQSATGETDGPDSDEGRLWDTAGVINIYGHPTNHNLTVSWASGGGVWLANGDNFCFTDTTMNQTACLTIHS
jgi:hypothetical protein